MCQCKSGKVQKLNNLDSTDHLKIAFDVYESTIKDKPLDYEYDDADKNLMIQAFFAVYPNAKNGITYQFALESLKNIYNQYYGK